MNEKDKAMTDIARLHKITIHSGDTQQFIYRWDEMLALMGRRPSDDGLVNIFVLHFDVHLHNDRGVYVECLFRRNREADDTIRGYGGLRRLVRA